jgi:hypothetical protein
MGNAGNKISKLGKDSGLATVTLNLRFQPRLPGSVVGEPSMEQGVKVNKITEGSVLR